MADEGTTSNVFGPTDDSMFAGIEGQEEAPLVTEETPETPEAEAPEPEPQTEQEQPQAEAPAPETPEAAPEIPEQPQEEQLYGGKFKTPEQILTAYEHAERLAHERARDAAEHRRRYEELERTLQQAAPALREFMQAQQAPIDPDDPDAVQALLERERSTMQAELDRRDEERRIEMEQVQTRQAIAQFRSAYPESPAHDMATWDVIQKLQAEAEDGFPVTPENLEVAYEMATNPQTQVLLDRLDYIPDRETVNNAKEAASNPALTEIAMANPQVLSTSTGMAWARKMAQLPSVVTNAQTNAQQASTQADEAARKAAFVERGEGQQPAAAPGRQPADPLAEALSEHLNQQTKSVFT